MSFAETYKKAEESANKHRRLYHYTDFNSLRYIIKNHSLMLTRIDKVNDLMENRHLIDLWKEKVFVSCFTHRIPETYFFWKSYPKSCNDGVRIDFCNIALNNSEGIFWDSECKAAISAEKQSSFEMKTEILNKDWLLHAFYKNDIIYAKRGSESEYENWAARCKYKEWDLEEETRIIAALRPNCFEANLIDLKFEYHRPNEEAIFLKLPSKCIETMRITLNPWADETLRSKVESLLKEEGLHKIVKVYDSVLKGEIKHDT